MQRKKIRDPTYKHRAHTPETGGACDDACCAPFPALPKDFIWVVHRFINGVVFIMFFCFGLRGRGVDDKVGGEAEERGGEWESSTWFFFC